MTRDPKKLSGALRPAGGVTFLDDESNHPADAPVYCFGVAMDLTASYTKGTWYGPQAALDASHQIEYETPLFGVPLTERVPIHNLGILEYPKPKQPLTPRATERIMSGMVQDVRRFTRLAHERRALTMMFGGDHSTPNGIFEEIAERYGAPNVTVFHVDAHLDLRLAYEGQKYSHASILRNVRDLGFPVVQVGPRDHLGGEEIDYIADRALGEWLYLCPTQPPQFYRDQRKALRNRPHLRPENLVWNGTLSARQIDRICRQVRTPYLYLTLDCDGIDAKEMPGTGTPLPHGLTLRTVEESLYALLTQTRKRGVQLLGFDINEISPMMRRTPPRYASGDTVTPMTEMNAALLAYKILFWNFLDRFESA